MGGMVGSPVGAVVGFGVGTGVGRGVGVALGAVGADVGPLLGAAEGAEVLNRGKASVCDGGLSQPFGLHVARTAARWYLDARRAHQCACTLSGALALSRAYK